MNALRTALHRLLRSGNDQGSAFLIALMVMVILTLIGVSFLVYSDTESQIAQNERDDYQVLYVAEAGVNVAKSWFNQPKTSKNPLVPSTTQVARTQRLGDSDWDGVDDVDGSGGELYEGGNRTGGRVLFDQPFRGRGSGGLKQTFWGYRDNPDILITETTDGGSYLNNLNKMFNQPKDKSLGVAKIKEIRIYRPPVATDIQLRLGVATLETTAVKEIVYPDGNRKEVSRRVVRDVIQEFPFPGPRGTIESAGLIKLQGNFQPHWGLVESEDPIDIKWNVRWYASVPRLDPGQSPQSQYDSSKYFNFRDINPFQLANFEGPAGLKSNLMRELVGDTQNGTNGSFAAPLIEDPWLETRTAKKFQDLTNAENANGKQPWPYILDKSVNGGKYTGKGNSRNFERSNALQQVSVKFPLVRYDVWKAVATSGEKGVNYYVYAGLGNGNEPNFRNPRTGETRQFAKWVNTNDVKNKPGLYFFDSKNSGNPQDPVNQDPNTKKPLNLTEAVSLSPGQGQPFIMQGFVYVNAAKINSSGLGNGVEYWKNMPGEPFNDFGIDLDKDERVFYCGQLDTSTICTLDPDASEDELATFQNEIWDVVFDPASQTGPAYTSDGDSFFSFYKQDGTKLTSFQNFETMHTFGTNVVPHDGNADGRADYDPRVYDPLGSADRNRLHEEFVNLDYPTVPSASNFEVRTDYDIDTGANTEPIDTGNASNKVSLNADPSGTAARFTSLASDRDGGLYKLKLHLDGVFFNEGLYDGQGNFVGYGSLLMKQGFQGSGTIDMYFDQSLMKNAWPPDSFNLPRVFSSSRETE